MTGSPADPAPAVQKKLATADSVFPDILHPFRYSRGDIILAVPTEPGYTGMRAGDKL
jgi:hypothetical protein